MTWQDFAAPVVLPVPARRSTGVLWRSLALGLGATALTVLFVLVVLSEYL